MRIQVLLFLIPFFAMTQESAVEKEPYFVALYTLGKNWDIEKQPNEQAYFKEHSAFLKKLRSEEIITMGARYGETGMILLKSKDLETAKTLIFSDVAIQNKLFNVEVRSFSPFYSGCIE